MRERVTKRRGGSARSKMDQSSVAAAGAALVVSVGNMTTSATNKLQDVSRKVTLASLLDDKSSSTTTTNSDKAIGKENSGVNNSASSRDLAGKKVFSERGNNSNTSTAASGHTNHVDLEALRDLRDLSSIVSEVERRAAALREAIDGHRRDNAARRAMSDATRQQTAQLAATLSALPEHLPHAAEAPARETAAMANGAAAAAAAASTVPPARSGGGNRRIAAKAAEPAGGGGDGEPNASAGRTTMAEVDPVELVTVGELNGVPRSTRGRLTIEQVNAAVTDIQKAIERRYILLTADAGYIRRYRYRHRER